MGTYNKRWHEVVWSMIGRTAARSEFAAKTLEIAGHVSSFSMWRNAHDLHAAAFSTREQMWHAILWPELRGGRVTVLEFGVAAGDMSRAWLTALPNRELTWHGFDTFSGLPSEWTRGGVTFAAAGSFDADGKPPAIDDDRVTWHVGRVESTLPEFVEPLRPGRICVLFDLDLYEPSKVVLDWLAPQLEPGDYLYFDEAYDPSHERRLLDEWLEQGVKLIALGWTGTALVVEYVGDR